MQVITVKIPMRKPTQRKQVLLEKATGLYRQAIAWYLEQLDENANTKAAVHSLYDDACPLFPLNRASLQCAGLEALGLIRAYRKNKKNGKNATLPQTARTHYQVRQDSYTIVRNNDSYVAKLPTVSGRGHQVRIPLLPDEHTQGRLDTFLEDGTVRKGSARIINKKGRWFLYLHLKFETDILEPSNVLGVDLGIVNLAVTSDGQFFSGRAVRFRKERLATLRKELQEKGRTSRAKKREHRDRRWMKHINHWLSRTIVDKANEQDAAIALEDLTGIRKQNKYGKSFNRMLSSWAFRELRDFIEYKAALAGLEVIVVNPRNTSHTCSRCGTKGNRHKSQFTCPSCGFKLNADLNAARNIRQRGRSSLVTESEVS